MSQNTIPELQGELASLFELGKQICETTPFPDSVLMVHGSSTYLFKDWGYRGYRSGAESVFPRNSGVTFELIASARGQHEAREESIFQTATEAREYATVPELYVIKSPMSSAELLAIAKQEHFLSICLAVIDPESESGVSKVEYFPAWWQRPDKEYFRERGIATGDYFCNSMVQGVLDLVARPEDHENFDPYDLETYSENELTYEAKSTGFVMNIKLIQKVGESDSDLVQVLRRIQRFLFREVDGFIGQTGATPFVDYFEDVLQLDKFPELRQRLEDEDVHPFVDYDERFASHSSWWVTPTALRIQVKKLRIDPSFGTATPDLSQTFELFELRDNWVRTDFEQISASAYLNRLVSQARQNGS